MQLHGKNYLTSLTKDLLRSWKEARNAWRDRKAEEFERDFLKGLEARVSRSVHKMERLEQVLSKLKKDCE